LPLDDPAMEVEFATNVACKSDFCIGQSLIRSDL
jgi:hypothetical protein